MTLSRRDLEEGRMRAIYMATVNAHRALSDEALAASLAATLAKKPAGSGWWVFAYGSLLWNPLFPFADGLIAAADAGATCAIQPGGSMRDEEVIKAADERGMAMVFTGIRHFKH